MRKLILCLILGTTGVLYSQQYAKTIRKCGDLQNEIYSERNRSRQIQLQRQLKKNHKLCLKQYMKFCFQSQAYLRQSPDVKPVIEHNCTLQSRSMCNRSCELSRY